MTAGTGSIWLRRHRSVQPPRLRLLCLPHAGGSAAFFNEWRHGFGPDVELLVACYPGRHERINDPVVTSMEALANALVTALIPYMSVPLVIFGHSMGATLGYELSVRLHQMHGVPPAALIVSGRIPPHVADERLPDPDDPDSVLASVRRLGGTDALLLDDPDLRELILPALLADFRVVADYHARPGIALPCPVYAYVGDDDPEVDIRTVRGWSRVASQDFELRVLPGDHFYLVDQRDRLIKDIRGRLECLVPVG